MQMFYMMLSHVETLVIGMEECEVAYANAESGREISNLSNEYVGLRKAWLVAEHYTELLAAEL